jgi:hypothetical protein
LHGVADTALGMPSGFRRASAASARRRGGVVAVTTPTDRSVFSMIGAPRGFL